MYIQLADASVFLYGEYRLCDGFGYADHLHFAALLAFKRNRVGKYQLFQPAVLNVLAGFAGHNTVCHYGADRTGSVLFHHLGRFAQCAPPYLPCRPR